MSTAGPTISEGWPKPPPAATRVPILSAKPDALLRLARGRTSDSIFKELGVCVRDLAAWIAPELCKSLLPLEKQRVQETPGARCTRSLACDVWKAHE